MNERTNFECTRKRGSSHEGHQQRTRKHTETGLTIERYTGPSIISGTKSSAVLGPSFVYEGLDLVTSWSTSYFYQPFALTPPQEVPGTYNNVVRSSQHDERTNSQTVS